MPKLESDRFWGKVDRRANHECWNWLASTDHSGYGRFGFRGKVVGAHRVSWEISRGEIPEGAGSHGTCVLHRCDNRKCVNPDHLFLGTVHDNVADMCAKGRNSHLGLAKLSYSDVIAIRSSAGRLKDISARYGVTPGHANRIRTGKRWQAVA